MQIFDVNDLECRYVKPNTSLSVWTTLHQPYAVCNASLYDRKTREPVGTIIEDGKEVHLAGNGYGVGIKDGKMLFGTPWGDKWSDYLTGYNSPVQNGKYVAPTFRDQYVFENKLARIGIGRKNGRTYIVTADSVTLRQFADDAIRSGFDTLVNLDGGGSRHLYYNGRAVYSSERHPYNALAWYRSSNAGDELIASCPYPKPLVTLRIGAKGDDVRWAQWQLNRHGAKLTVDGSFGILTWYAARKFQRDNGLTVDGIVGKMTISALSGI